MRVNAATIKAVAAIASKDGTREILTGALVDPETGTVTVTDSYRLITARAVEPDSESESALLLRPETVKDLTASKIAPYGTTITAEPPQNGTQYASARHEVTGATITAPTICADKFPAYAQLMTSNANERTLTAAITVNAKSLAQVLTAMDKIGADTVTIAFGDPHKPITITPSRGSECAALVMPVRGNGATAADIAHVIATVTALTTKAGE